MNIQYSYNKEIGYIHAKVSGQISTVDVKNYVSSLLADKNITSPFYEITDFTNIDNFEFGYLESDSVLNEFKELKEIKNYIGSCIVVNRDYLKGISHIFEIVGEDKGFDIKVFTSFEDALDYVKNNT